MNKIVETIRNSNIYRRQVKSLEKKHIEYEEKHGMSWVRLCTNHHDYLFYVSKQNINHIFRVRVFNISSIQSRLIGKGSRNITDKLWHDRDIKVHRDEKIITYRNTDLGNTNNVNRLETTKETLGHPFKRKVSYNMMVDGKDRLQYRRECIELHTYDKNNKRKKIIDNVFATRVYRLFLRFKGYTSNNITSILLSEESIDGHTLVEILKYLYQVMNSYHPFFYKDNGLPKYNRYWLKDMIYKIETQSNLDMHIPFCKVNRNKNIDSRIVKPKDIEDWRKAKQLLEEKQFVDIE